MRRWIVIPIIVLAGLVVALLVIVANFNRYLDANRELLAKQLETAIGREVRFAGLSVSFEGGLAAEIKGLQVADDPAFATDRFLQVDRAHVVVSIWDALFGEYNVRTLVLEEPVINIVRTARGYNFDSLAKDEQPKASRAPSDGGDAAALPVTLALVQVEDGLVRLTDRTVSPPRNVEIRDLDVRATDLSTTQPIDFEIDAAVLADSQNIHAKGRVGPLAAKFPQLALSVDADSLDVGALAAQVPSLREALPPDLAVDGPLEASIEIEGYELASKGGKMNLPALIKAEVDAGAAAVRWGEYFAKPSDEPLQLRVDAVPNDNGLKLKAAALESAGLNVDTRGSITTAGDATTVDLRVETNDADIADLARLSPAISLNDASGSIEVAVDVRGRVGQGQLPQIIGTVVLDDVGVSVGEAPTRISGLSTTVQLDGHRAVLPETRFTVADAPIQLSGTAESWAPPIQVAMKVSTENAPLEKMVRGEKLRGRLHANLDVAGRGGNADELLASLKGDGRVSVEDGELRGVNVPERVLSSVSGISGLSNLLTPLVSERYPAMLRGENTEFDEASATIMIAGRRLRTNDLIVAAKDYALQGSGVVTFDAEIDADATLIASRDLTELLSSGVRQVSLLANNQGQLSIPFSISGTWPQLRVRPDPEIAQALAGAAVRRGLGELLGDEERSAGDAPPDETRDPVDAIERGVRDLLGR